MGSTVQDLLQVQPYQIKQPFAPFDPTVMRKETFLLLFFNNFLTIIRLYHLILWNIYKICGNNGI
jgi:hypothetical protein